MHIYHNIYSIKIIGLLVPCLLLLWACSDAVRLLSPLPEHVVPVHYDLKLIFDIDPETNFSYFGVVSISMKITRSVNQIVVHSYGYQIDPDGLTISGYEHTPMIVDTKYEPVSHQFTILLEDYLRPLETYTVTIAYSGNLDPSAKDGVVIGQYIQEVNYIREYFLTTLFKPTSAHKVFPCMDEPGFKASYHISLGHNKEFSAISNMPRDAERTEQSNLIDVQIPWNIIMMKFNKLESSFVWSVFATSRPMSTFLVGFVIARMQPVEALLGEDRAKFAVWTRPQLVTQVSKAVSVGSKLIRVLEHWYQLSFPLPKLDVLALPAGAPEAQHWGLITLPEHQLLDKRSPSILDDVPFAKMLARHMAQQWFGDIVTLVHWSEMWFNDCLAALVAGQAVAGLRPDWGPLIDRDDTSDIMFVLEQDAMPTSTAVGKPIPEGFYTPLDELNIAKGAFLIKMMNNVLGNDVFHEAIFSYMDRYIYSSACLDDFFSIVTQLCVQRKALPDELSVKQLMQTWIAQAGFPLLTLKRNYKDKTVNVTQVQYLSMGGVAAAPATWWVPLQLACEGDSERAPLQWLAPKEGFVREPKEFNHCAAADQWLLLNVDIIAPFRVNYDERNWKLISTVLHSSQLNQVSTLTRVQLLADAFELAWNGLLHYSIPIKITTYLSQEPQYQPMKIGLHALSKIETFLKRNLEYGTFKHYVRGFISERYAAGGLARKEVLDSDDLDSVRMQTLMSEWGCRMSIPGCEENAVQLFQSWMDRDLPDENNPIPVVLRRTVYCTAVARGSLTHWQFVLARKKNTNDTTDGEALQYALSCSKDIWVLKKLLSWSITSCYRLGVMAPVAVFTHVLESPLGFYIGKDFFYANIDEIRKILSPTELGTVIKAMLSQFGTSADIDEFLQWREAHVRSLKDVLDVIDRELSVARGNVVWMQKNGDEVIKQMKETSLQVDDEEFLQFHLMASSTQSKENVLKSSVLLLILCVSINFIEF